MTKLFNKYKEMLSKEVLTERNIIAIKSRLHNNPHSLTEDELDSLSSIIEGREFFIDSDHTEKGLNYLKDRLFKQNGSYRNTKQTNRLSDNFREAVKDFNHFKFSGFISLGRYNASPIWTIVTNDDTEYSYFMNAEFNFQEL